MSIQETTSTTTTTTTTSVTTSNDCRIRDVIDVLTSGRESALELLDCLLDDDSLQLIIPRMLEKITSSFDNAIIALNSGDRSASEVSPKSEDTGETSKQNPLGVRKGRRGCYKRRKGSQSWTKVVPNLADDGHGWRKYGQKAILNTPHPRSYFRCTHKKEQGCPATKQVQMTQSDPPMYTITYDGHHTCNNLLNSPTLFVDSAQAAGETSVMLSFDSAAEPTTDQSQSPLLFGSPPSTSYMFAQDFPTFEGMASDESSNCSNLEDMEFLHPQFGAGIGICVEDFDDDVMKLEY